MNLLMLYLLKSAGALTAVYGVYFLFLRKDTFFALNRFYLLGAVLFASIIPLIPMNFLRTGPAGSLAILLDPVTVTPAGLKTGSSVRLSWPEILIIIYLTGAALFLLRLLIQVVQLLALIRKSDVKFVDIMKVVPVDKSFSPFSFFNYVFINKRQPSGKDLDAILAHEKVHVEQRHSLDLILMEMACVVQWFNPFIWLASKNLRDIHEFLADEGALQSGIVKGEYEELILNESTGLRLNYLTNNFNVSLIKNRILMMTKPRSQPMAKSKLAIALPVVLAVMLLFAGNSLNTKAYAQNNSGTSGTATAPTPPHPSPQHQVSARERQGNENDTVYERVEKQPAYPGGTDALFNFLLQNLKYPKLAMEKKTMGTVFVYFVVKADGSVDNVRIKRGIGNGCDEEAIRVVKLMPKWVPGEDHGKKVNVAFYLPIQFKLNASQKKK